MLFFLLLLLVVILVICFDNRKRHLIMLRLPDFFVIALVQRHKCVKRSWYGLLFGCRL